MEKYCIIVLNQETNEVIRKLNNSTSFVILADDGESIACATHLKIFDIDAAAAMLKDLNLVREKLINSNSVLMALDMSATTKIYSKFTDVVDINDTDIADTFEDEVIN